MTATRTILPMNSRTRRIVLRANLGVIAILALAIFGMVNHLASFYSVRWHSSGHVAARLSRRTQQVLDAVPEDIRITAVLRPAHDAYRPLQALLREYASAGAVTTEFVDPDRELARTEEVARRFHLDGAEGVVVEVGGRHRILPAAEFLRADDPGAPHPSRRRAFHGEPLLSGAIHALTQPVRPTVHFIQGHGERSPADFDPRTGYSRIASRLRDDNLDVEILNLGVAKAVPNHCALMIIAGPAREFAPFEVSLIRDYLDRKGRLLLLLDARTQTGLEPLLRHWGVQVGDDIVMDPMQTLSGRELYLTSYADHPITRSLEGLATVFYLPRSIRPLDMGIGSDKPAITELAFSSASGWAEFSPEDATPRFDPHVDVPGPVPVAVAIERGPVPGVHIQILPTRLVVVGDSMFASNGGLMGANADFFLHAVNWLLERDELLAVAPARLDQLRLVATRHQLRRLFAVVVLGLPGLVAALGLVLAWRRSHAA